MSTTALTAPGRGFFDSRFNARIINVAPGSHGISDRDDEVLSTLLGSCVAACIRDRETGHGGMNHFLLPGDDENGGLALSGEDMRFGVNAMEVLINALIRRGARRDRLEAKIFGGADMKTGARLHAVGERNASFARRFLDREGIPILRQDLGGGQPRRVNYQPATGRAWVSHIDRPRAAGVLEAETEYRRSLKARPTQAILEIF